MVAAVRFVSRISGLLLFAALALDGCARTAPDLPPAYGTSGGPGLPDLTHFDQDDAALTCEKIAAERFRIRRDMEAIETTIIAKHGTNQGIGYAAGVIFPPLLLAADNSLKAKELLDANQARLDRLALLERVKACPSEK